MTSKLLQLADFLPYVGTDFMLALENGAAYSLRLLSAQPLSASLGANALRESFDLCFLGAGPLRLEQDLYRLTHSVSESRDIFLVPIGSNELGFLYQAVFN